MLIVLKLLDVFRIIMKEEWSKYMVPQNIVVGSEHIYYLLTSLSGPKTILKLNPKMEVWWEAYDASHTSLFTYKTQLKPTIYV